ncbi:MAG: hypothetical protein J5679_02840 [Alphaproteobacteria bacterium]|nr:hypothetical protein [Alphaproteobacteria bacterium]
MKLDWQQKNFESDIDFILFHQQDDTPNWWRKRLFDVYIDLNYKYARSLPESKRFEYITKKMKTIANEQHDIINKSIKMFQKSWSVLAGKLNSAYAAAFDNDCSGILNDMTANVGLNPICPRDITNHSFDVFYFFDPKYAMTVALHEITHMAWFHFWQKHFRDNPAEYDSPHLKWVLSEIVVETIIRNSKINDLVHEPQYIAYSYFYDMHIGGELVFDKMKQLYLKRKDINDFMEKAYDWIKNNEKELRKKIADAER